MKRPVPTVTAAAIVILALHVIATYSTGQWWGLDSLHYLGKLPSAMFIIVTLTLILIGLFGPVPGRADQERPRPIPSWVLGLGFLFIALVVPPTATPLLGDGVDRIEALPAGFKALSGQPAPLDLILHILAYQALSWLHLPAWELSWRVWRILSYVAGAAGAAMVWKLASLRAGSPLGRVFLFTVIFLSGTAVFFFGYVEDYVLLAAGIYGFFMLAELAARGRVPAGALVAALAVLAGLHLFMLLLVPPVLYTLYSHKLWKPSRAMLTLIGLAMAAAGVVSLVMVHERFRGTAIFVFPHLLFSSYHLMGFLNQQLLACPVLPLLLLLAVTGQDSGGPDPLLTMLGASALVITVFFLFLRPVIGPAADWDLFAVPSLFYTPWIALRVMRRWRASTAFPVLAWQTSALALACLAPWLLLNMSESGSVARFKDLMDREARYNQWSASYGYYRLAKYQAHRGGPWGDDDVLASLARAVEINPDSPVIRLQEAQLLAGLGHGELAREQMTEHFLKQGALDEREGRYGEAADQYRKALALTPGSKPALAALVRLYDGELNDPATAEQYRKALEQTAENHH